MSLTGTPEPSEATDKIIGFFLTPKFSPLGFFGAIEVLRTANRFLGRPFYGWRALSMDGAAVLSANGVAIVADGVATSAEDLDALFVCGGYEPEAASDAKTLRWLRLLARNGTQLGAISTGTQILADAGIIGDRHCAIHRDNAVALKEQYPDIKLVDGLFETDCGLYTCAGGTSAIDLFIHMVSSMHGERFAADIAHQFQQDRVRTAEEEQSKVKRFGLSIKSEKLVQALDIMEQNIERPLSSTEIAHAIGVSERQLQRLFRKHTGRSPQDFYIGLRLNHGHLLVLQTAMPVVEIAVATGFSSNAHFTKYYRKKYGISPRDRRQHAA